MERRESGLEEVEGENDVRRGGREQGIIERKRKAIPDPVAQSLA